MGGIDLDTPVVDLHDPDDAGRDGLVTFSDDERHVLSWVLDRARVRLELDQERSRRRRWYDSAAMRWAAFLGALAAVGTMVAAWVQIAGHR